MMEFILGCNYWASHAGTEMWRSWDEATMIQDLQILKNNGIEYLRVFPNWRDFQPVKPLLAQNGDLVEYCLEDETIIPNKYFLDEKMTERFCWFCDLAERFQLKLIVGLLTGWMSGRLFIPSALFDKDLYTDPTALLLEQKFISGFIQKVKDRISIYAWDLGNECNCMGNAKTREIAANWTAVISNVIRANDNTRPIISGMHSLSPEAIWTIQDQGEYTDILTTHPYPYWVPHCSDNRISSIKTLLHGTAESLFYSSIGHKPCLVEELGTMGPMVCDEQTAANFMRVNLFSNWAYGHLGVMWWCACDQTHLTTAPYSWNMCERELGLLTINSRPKPVLKEIQKFSEWIHETQVRLAPLTYDAICILTKGQDHWGIAYHSFVLAKQAGINLTFCYADDDIPQSNIYFMPSITGHMVMKKSTYDDLKNRVSNGAILYLSGHGFLTEFEDFVGMRIVDSENTDKKYYLDWKGKELEFYSKRYVYLSQKSASVLAYDDLKNPCVTVNNYGKGKVYYLNFPLEEMLITQNKICGIPYYFIYREILSQEKTQFIISSVYSTVGITIHKSDLDLMVVAINYSNQSVCDFYYISSDYQIGQTLYGNPHEIQPFDASIFTLDHITLT